MKRLPRCTDSDARRHARRGVSGSLEAIMILAIIVPFSWLFYLMVKWWCRLIFDVIAPLVQWPYL